MQITLYSVPILEFGISNIYVAHWIEFAYINNVEVEHCIIQLTTKMISGCMDYIDGLVQNCSNSIANAMELLQSYTKPSIYEYKNNDFKFTYCLLFTLSFTQCSIQVGEFSHHLAPLFLGNKSFIITVYSPSSRPVFYMQPAAVTDTNTPHSIVKTLQQWRNKMVAFDFKGYHSTHKFCGNQIVTDYKPLLCQMFIWFHTGCTAAMGEKWMLWVKQWSGAFIDKLLVSDIYYIYM